MNNTIPLSSLLFMSVPLAMSEFTAFSASTRHLTWLLLAGSKLSALRTALLLRLPVRGAAVVAAQRIGPGLTVSLLRARCCAGCETRFSCLWVVVWRFSRCCVVVRFAVCGLVS
jgi:hypothetical protein